MTQTSSVTKAEIREWEDHPVTKAFLDEIDKQIEEECGRFADGAFLADRSDETLKASSLAVGRLNGLQFIFGWIALSKESDERERDIPYGDESFSQTDQD